MSLLALTTRSLRSWCSSSSARKVSNMAIMPGGDGEVFLSAMIAIGVPHIDLMKTSMGGVSTYVVNRQ